MNRTIIITDQFDISNEKKAKLYIFNHLNVDAKGQKIFLSKILDEKSDLYKNKYLKFYDTIYFNIKKNIKLFSITKNYNNFISSLFFEKSPFKTNIFLQMQMMVLFDLLSKEKVSNFEIRIKNKLLEDSVKNLIMKLNNKKKNMIFFNFNYEIKYYLSLFYSILKVLILSLKSSSVVNFKIKKIVFFSSYKKQYSNKNDVYWKEIINKIKCERFNLFLLDYENCFVKKKKINNSFYSSDFFNFNDFLVLIFKYFFVFKFKSQIKFIYKIIEKNEYNFLISLLAKDMKKSISGSVFIENYFNSISITKFLEKTNNYQNYKFFFPCEFHPHENYINQCKKNIITYGFVHSTLRYWLFNYFFSKNLMSKIKKNFYLPKYILLNGNFSFIEMQKFINKKTLLQVEAIRHLNLNKKIKVKKEKTFTHKKIFYGDIQSNSTLSIINMLKHNPKIKNIIYKPHPLCKLKIKNQNFKNFSLFVSNDSVLKDSQTNLNIFGSTSYALEFYLMKKKIIVFKDETNLNLSPLFYYITKKFSDYENQYILNNTRDDLNFYFNLNKNLKLWNKIIKFENERD